MVDFDAQVNAVCVATFPTAVSYKAKGRDERFDITGVFDEAWADVATTKRGGFSLPVSTTKPCLGVRGSDFPEGVEPAQGDTFRLKSNNKRYEVADTKPDGISGWVLLVCK